MVFTHNAIYFYASKHKSESPNLEEELSNQSRTCSRMTSMLPGEAPPASSAPPLRPSHESSPGPTAHGATTGPASRTGGPWWWPPTPPTPPPPRGPGPQAPRPRGGPRFECGGQWPPPPPPRGGLSRTLPTRRKSMSSLPKRLLDVRQQKRVVQVKSFHREQLFVTQMYH